jgi:hypothetical protein
MENILPIQTLRSAWLAIDAVDFMKKTTGPKAIDPMAYMEEKLTKTVKTRAHYSIRGKKGACARWGKKFVAPSIESVLDGAESMAKHIREGADYALRWIANAPKRREIARKGGIAKRDKKQHAPSMARARVEGDSRSPGILNNSKRDTPPTPPNAFAGPWGGSEGQYGGNPVPVSGKRRTPRQSSFWRVFKKAFNSKNADPRFEPFREEISKCYREKNSHTIPEFIWDKKTCQALEELLKCFPALDLDTLKGWLLNWAWSETNHTEPPSKWIGELSMYAEGRLDRYKKLMRRNC